MSAPERVFDTPELCEAILLSVPPKDLLVSAQRVSTYWQASIAGSFSLQRKLFFKQFPERNQEVVPTATTLYEKILPSVTEWVIYEYGADFLGSEMVRKKLHTPIFVAYFDLEKPMEENEKETQQSWTRMFATSKACKIYIAVDYRKVSFESEHAMSLNMAELMTIMVIERMAGLEMNVIEDEG